MLVSSLIYLLVVLLILGLVYWVTTLFPLPHPFPLIIRVVFVVIGVLLLINFLLALTGTPLFIRG